MNRVKRTARKRHIRQEVNQFKLDGFSLGAVFQLATDDFSAKRDWEFTRQVVITQEPYRIINPLREALLQEIGRQRLFNVSAAELIAR